MPCESCGIQFSVFRRKRGCVECERYYCSACLRRGGGTMCAACRVLCTRPLTRHSLAHLKVRDLQYFLQRQNVSTRGCVEKEDLVNLVILNSTVPRRRPPPRSAQDFSHSFTSSIKGFTNNINSLFNSAFDIRTQNGRSQSNTSQNCFNSNHSHGSNASGATAQGPLLSSCTVRVPADAERPTIIPQQVPEVNVTQADEGVSQDTADCLEIEDLDDAADWEFINQPAEPLPNDSHVLISENADLATESPINMRAASELDLRRSESADTADTASLKEEPFVQAEPSLPKRIRLEDLKQLSDLERLTPKQLKELLALNRVDFKGCVERKELLERAKRLLRESLESREELNKLSLEDSCKICMDAPMECVLLECGHMAACTDCSKKLSECPICRQYVVRAVRVFRS